VLLRLAVLTGKEQYRNVAIAVFRAAGDAARRYPSGFGYLLSAIDFSLSTPKEIAIIGDDAPHIEPLLTEVWRRYLPNKVVAPAFGQDAQLSALPLLQDRSTINNQATAYVCEHYTCKKPVNDPQSLAAQLDG
jgi:uncharacterized protein YyaL (SSP411 family)